MAAIWDLFRRMIQCEASGRSVLPPHTATSAISRIWYTSDCTSSIHQAIWFIPYDINIYITLSRIGSNGMPSLFIQIGTIPNCVPYDLNPFWLISYCTPYNPNQFWLTSFCMQYNTNQFWFASYCTPYNPNQFWLISYFMQHNPNQFWSRSYCMQYNPNQFWFASYCRTYSLNPFWITSYCMPYNPNQFWSRSSCTPFYTNPFCKWSDSVTADIKQSCTTSSVIPSDVVHDYLFLNISLQRLRTNGNDAAEPSPDRLPVGGQFSAANPRSMRRWWHTSNWPSEPWRCMPLPSQ